MTRTTRKEPDSAATPRPASAGVPQPRSGGGTQPASAGVPSAGVPQAASAGVQRPREATKLETREALVSAGLAEFAEHGLDTPSLDAICARAGFTRGAFYVHFRGREDFLDAVMKRVGARVLDSVLGGGSELGSSESGLDAGHG